MLESSAKIWKHLPDATRLKAADAFWKEEDGLEQQIEALGLLARHMKARPKFIAGLSTERRAKYLAAYPSMPEALAARLLVSYHLAHQRPMLRAFLDALGLKHEDGLIAEDQEQALAASTLGPAAAALDEQFPHPDVTVYLATLLTQDPSTWAGLADLPQVTRFLSANP
jgi:hypothetical protein